MNLKISPILSIPYYEFKWRFSLASGAGGQKINKTFSRVEIIFDINNSKALTSFQKFCLINKLKSKLKKGCISITVQEKRNQYGNRKIALLKMKSIIGESLKVQKIRYKTKASKQSIQKRIDNKKKRSLLKQMRKINNSKFPSDL